MEKNYFEKVLGAVAITDTVEGRMVCLTSHSISSDFGSQSDLPGVKVPGSADDAARAKYIVTFAAENRSLPIYQPQPAFSYALRYGFDQAANAPFSATVYITSPDVQEGLTIPSGSNCLIYTDGVFTVPSGSFVYSAAVANPGTLLEVNYSGATAGKLQEKSAGTAVAEVVRFNSTEYSLMFKTL